MSIGAVAEATRLASSASRYYERQGPLALTMRNAVGCGCIGTGACL